ncbi:MAG: hypothetical protein HQ510_02920 [Candidatus Marinimicrobia bacterium]|nr:hypothetical protein [Candidatus Neomarinimicrobiota bacterium]
MGTVIKIGMVLLIMVNILASGYYGCEECVVKSTSSQACICIDEPQCCVQDENPVPCCYSVGSAPSSWIFPPVLSPVPIQILFTSITYDSRSCIRSGPYLPSTKHSDLTVTDRNLPLLT